MFCVSVIEAQTLYDIRGKVTSSGVSLVGVVVIIPELSLWGITDTEGDFVVKNVPQGEWQMEFRLVGYRTSVVSVTVPIQHSLSVIMQEESYELDDVTITARQGAGAGTASVIDRTAFEHQQTVSVADALQLLPGGVTDNPSLNKQKVLTLRETSSNDATSAMGTALVIDNAQFTNDANMQDFTSVSNVESMPNTTATGPDVRVISTDRIESVEVIRGVASVEYGNLTSGAVIVKTKASASPTNVSLKIDPKLKSLSLSRGFNIGRRGAVVAADVDLAKSYNDVRSKSMQFKRLTGQLAYSSTFDLGDAKFILNAKSNGFISQNVEESDPDKHERNYIKEVNKNLSLNINGNFLANTKWLTSMRFNVTTNIGHQISEVLDAHIGELPTPYTSSLISGEHEGAFYPSQYDEIMRVDGKPLTLQMKVTANKSHTRGALNGHFIVGVEYNLKGNNGEGKTGEYLSMGMRPRSFKDVPFVSDWSLYAEEKFRLPILNTRIELQAGLRLTSVNAQDYDFATIVDPRINIRYVLFDKKSSLFALRAGWGIQHKMPTLVHLYPDPAYMDRVSYSYLDNSTQTGIALFTTKVLDDTQNKDLLLPQSNNIELGVEVKHNKHFKFDATLFYENLKHGFSYVSNVTPMSYKVYQMTTQRAEYTDGVLFIGEELVPYNNDTVFYSYQRPVNAMEIKKQGMEFTFDFGKIESINTQVIVDGMFIDINRQTNAEEAYYKNGTINGSNRKYAAMRSVSTFNVSHTKRLNTNLRLITRIPSLGLIFSIKGQCVWIDKARRSAELNGKSLVSEIDGEKVVLPTALIGFSGNIITNVSANIISDVQTMEYVQRLKPNALEEDNPKPYALADLRMTKEIGRWLQFSLYVNNFTNRNPKRYLKSSDVYVYKNSEIYFGCDMKIKL